MNEQPEISRGRRIVVTIALMVFLVGTPLMSYFYLFKGYNYHLDALKDLRKTHHFSEYGQLSLLDGQAPKDDLFGNLHVLGLLPETANPNFPLYGEVLQDLHEQFDRPSNIEFWSVFENQDSAFIANYQRSHSLLADTSQMLYWTGAERGMGSFIAQLGLTEEEQNWLPDGIFVLVDDSLYVRRAYPLNDREEIRKLVERIAIILPERKEPKAELRRKEEL